MSNPFNQHDIEEEKAYKNMIVTCIAAASLVVLLFLVVLYQNAKAKQVESKRLERQIALEEANRSEDEFILEDKNFVSSDLDFWDLYSPEEIVEEEEEGAITSYKDGKPVNDDIDNKKNKDSNNYNNESLNKKSKTNNETSDTTSKEDNKKLSITDADGNTMYYEILSSVDTNKYDFTKNLTTDDNGRKSYLNGSVKSKMGVTLSQNDGTIDFSRVKADGVEFAFLRIAMRGYQTGIITLDDKFVEYANGCNATGIKIGAYFTSQAINEQEAIEEASYAVGAVKNFNVKYPIAIDLTAIDINKARNDSLSMKERTAVVKAFCDTVKEYGFKPVIRGTRNCLISKLNLEDLNNYDVWLIDEVQETDYPYDFTIWQYSKNISIDGIEKNPAVSLSFVNYEER